MNVTAKLSPRLAHEIIESRFEPDRNDVPTVHRLARDHRIGAILMRMKRLTQEQFDQAISELSSGKKPLGRRLVDKKIITRNDLIYALGVDAGFLRETSTPPQVASMLEVVRNPYSKKSKSFRSISSILDYDVDDSQSPKTIMVLGAHDQSSSNYVSINTAISLAQLGKRVLFINSDGNSDVFSSSFRDLMSGIKIQGLDSGNDQWGLSATNIVNLDYLAIYGADNRAESLSRHQDLGRAIESHSDGYDITIVFAQDYGENSECELLFPYVKDMFVVARRHVARGPALRKLRRSIERAGGRILGSILIG